MFPPFVCIRISPSRMNYFSRRPKSSCSKWRSVVKASVNPRRCITTKLAQFTRLHYQRPAFPSATLVRCIRRVFRRCLWRHRSTYLLMPVGDRSVPHRRIFWGWFRCVLARLGADQEIALIKPLHICRFLRTICAFASSANPQSPPLSHLRRLCLLPPPPTCASNPRPLRNPFNPRPRHFPPPSHPTLRARCFLLLTNSYTPSYTACRSPAVNPSASNTASSISRRAADNVSASQFSERKIALSKTGIY